MSAGAHRDFFFFFRKEKFIRHIKKRKPGTLILSISIHTTQNSTMAEVINRKRSANTASLVTDSKRRKPTVIKSKVLNPVDQDGISECFHLIRTSLYVSLAPSYLSKPLEGIKAQHLDTLIMRHSNDLKGVIIGYENVQLENQSLESKDILSKVNPHSPFAFLWISVDFLVWRPMVGDVLEGFIYMQSPSHIGLLINDTFNASIKKVNIPDNWNFVPNQVDEYSESEDKPSKSSLGSWCDENYVPIDGKLKFTVKRIHTTGRVVSVEGSLVKPGAESDSLPVIPNATPNKKIKFDHDLPLPNSEAGQEDNVPSYDKDSEDEVVNEKDSSNDEESDSD